jgi:putative transcriptional regulator
VDLDPGTLLVAPTSVAADTLFARTAILILDREPSGITTGLAITRPLQDQRAMDASALVLRFISDPNAPAFWGGPMGKDPAILAELTSTDGLEWFHLHIQQPRPFPLPNVGVIAVAEHTDVFDGRITRARLYVGLCVWARNQLEREVERGDWLLTRATPDDLFSADPEALWPNLVARAQGHA